MCHFYKKMVRFCNLHFKPKSSILGSILVYDRIQTFQTFQIFSIPKFCVESILFFRNSRKSTQKLAVFLSSPAAPGLNFCGKNLHRSEVQYTFKIEWRSFIFLRLLCLPDNILSIGVTTRDFTKKSISLNNDGSCC